MELIKAFVVFTIDNIEVSRQIISSGKCTDSNACYASIHQKCMNICRGIEKDYGGYANYTWCEEEVHANVL